MNIQTDVCVVGLSGDSDDFCKQIPELLIPVSNCTSCVSVGTLLVSHVAAH